MNVTSFELNTAWYPLSAVLLLLCLSSVAAAEPPPVIDESMTSAVSNELELLKEEETVSIASRYEQPISQAPSNVYVITDEDIRQSGAIDLPTVLRRVPGLEIMQMTGGDFNVSARGGNQPFANKMLVMVDGRSIYGDVQGTVFWKSIPVTLPEIRRIEVLKGPASAMYGFNAFDGVINIITKSPEEMKGTTLQFGGGELGTISSAAVHAGLTRAVGVSNYSAKETRSIHAELAKRDVALATNQIEFSLLRRSPETGGLLATCQELGVLPLAYSPIGQGRLTGKYSAQNPPPGKRGFSAHPMEQVDAVVAELRRVGEAAGGRTPSQVAPNWIIAKGAVPIPGAKNRAQAEENAGALGWALSTDQVAALDAAALGGIRSLSNRFWQHG